jgi:hypothetical protein
MIWKLAATRLIEVRWNSTSGFTFSGYPPAMLTLCRESYDVTHGLFWPAEEQAVIHNISFNWDVDTLYFPYPSPCSTSYGLSLGRFLNRYCGFRRLKHLALCLPPRTPADGTCMEFLRAVQERARRTMDYGYELETLTLVFGDPYMVDFKTVPKRTDVPNLSTQALAQPQNQSMNTASPAPTSRYSIRNTRYPEYPKQTPLFPRVARHLCDINEAHTSQSWNRDAAAEALQFHLGSEVRDIERYGPPLCPTFGMPEIIWKGVNRGVDDEPGV